MIKLCHKNNYLSLCKNFVNNTSQELYCKTHVYMQIEHFHQWMEEGIVYPTMKCIRLNERTKLLQQFT